MMASSDVVGVFDRAAATYDAVGVPFFGPVADELVAELAPRAGERVLDVGCGRGAVLVPVAERVGPSGRAVGLDRAPEMARRTAVDLAGLPQASVLIGDAVGPPFRTGSFDVVASSLVVFFLPSPLTALARWTRLLVPGGRLGVTTFAEEDEAWRAVDACFAAFVPPEPEGEETEPLPWDSDAGMEELLTAGGLVDVRTVSRTVTARFRDVDQLVAFSWSHGQRAWWEAIATARRADLRSAIGDAVAGLGFGTGEIVLEQQVRCTLGRRAPLRTR